jgi:23S rRNA (guanosine2251-2'-O)-methyltransferase
MSDDVKRPRGKPPANRFQRGRVRPSASPGGLRQDGLQVIYGIHSVREALANPARRISRLIATENGAARLLEDGPISVEPVIVRPDDIGRQLTPDSVHQGVLLLAEPLPAPEIEDLADDAVIIVLDQVTDPHNVGAILRSAAAFGVSALVTTQRHSPEITGVVAKAASGALEHVPLVHVGNLARGIGDLQKRGFLVVGLDSAATEELEQVPLRRPLALVMGAEGKGLRQLTRATCDVVARLSLPGRIQSLNVSNAAAVALYAIRRALG